MPLTPIEKTLELSAYKQAELRQICQSVSVEVLHLYPFKVDLKGEFSGHSPLATASRLERLKQMLSLLTQIAHEFHALKNADNGQIKSNCKNSITQLVSPEFFFYPHETPLTPAEFIDLIQHIKTIASQCLPNLHLVFSSFAVAAPHQINDQTLSALMAHIEKATHVWAAMDEGTELILPYNTFTAPRTYLVNNVAIHVQCGPQPIIKLIAKMSQHSVDLKYATSVNSSSGANFPLFDDHTFLCETLGGARFFTSLEICFDHAIGTASFFLQKLLDEKLKNEEDTTLLPPLANPIISAHGVRIHEKMLLSPVRTHADLSVATTQPWVVFPPNFEAAIKQLNQHKSLEQPGTQLIYSAGAISIKSPSFGEDCYLLSAPKKYLDTLPKNFIEQIETHNKTVIHTRIPVAHLSIAQYGFFSGKKDAPATQYLLATFYQYRSAIQNLFKMLSQLAFPTSAMTQHISPLLIQLYLKLQSLNCVDVYFSDLALANIEQFENDPRIKSDEAMVPIVSGFKSWITLIQKAEHSQTQILSGSLFPCA